VKRGFSSDVTLSRNGLHHKFVKLNQIKNFAFSSDYRSMLHKAEVGFATWRNVLESILEVVILYMDILYAWYEMHSPLISIMNAIE